MENNVNFYDMYKNYYNNEVAFQNMYISTQNIDYNTINYEAKRHLVYNMTGHEKVLYDAFGAVIDDRLLRIINAEGLMNVEIESVNSLIIQTGMRIIYAHF